MRRLHGLAQCPVYVSPAHPGGGAHVALSLLDILTSARDVPDQIKVRKRGNLANRFL